MIKKVKYMYWNVFKREVETGKLIKLVKSFPCYGFNDFDIKWKAECVARRKNFIRHFWNKYYYTVEYDFE